EAGLDHGAYLAGFELEDRFVERLHHLAAGEKAQVAAVVLAAGIVGVLAGEFGEIAALLELGQDRIGFGFGVGLFFIAGVFDHADQDVAGACLLGMAESGFVVALVIGLDVLVRERDSLAELHGV